MPTPPWDSIDDWLSRNAPGVKRRLRPGAARARIEALERALGVTLPVDLVVAYEAHDGAERDARSLFGAIRVTEAAAWVREMEWLSTGDAIDVLGFVREQFAGKWPQAWLPVAKDAGDNLIVYDVHFGRLLLWENETWDTWSLAPTSRAAKRTIWEEESAMAIYFRDFVPFDPGPQDPYQRAHSPLGIGDLFFSATRAFRLGLQGDGNLVMYVIDDGTLPPDITQGRYVTPIWASNTVGSNAHSWVMQGDGNLVIYNGLWGTGSAVWSSETAGHPGAFLRIQDDGNLVIYAGAGAIWSSNTYAGPR